jgi:hypothetical protein
MAASTRSAVTLDTAASRFVTDGAVRLFLSGYLAKLHYIGAEDGSLHFSIASESTPGQTYSLEYVPADRTIRCGCPVGQHNVPCKHITLWKLSRGLTSQEAGA